MLGRSGCRRFIFRSISLVLIMAMSLGINSYAKENDAIAIRRHAAFTEVIGIYDGGGEKSANTLTVYGLGRKRAYGMSPKGPIEFEGFFGVSLKISGNTVTIQPYDHTNMYDTSRIVITKMDSMTSETIVMDFGIVHAGKELSYEITEKGVYSVVDDVSSDDAGNVSGSDEGREGYSAPRGYLYYDGESLRTCRVTTYSADALKKIIDHWNGIMDGVAPSACRSNEGIS